MFLFSGLFYVNSIIAPKAHLGSLMSPWTVASLYSTMRILILDRPLGSQIVNCRHATDDVCGLAARPIRPMSQSISGDLTSGSS